MTENTEPQNTPDPTAETTPIEVPVQAPPQPAIDAGSSRKGVPAWAVISGAAAAGLIVVAGVGGYALGQAGDSNGDRAQRIEAGQNLQGQNAPQDQARQQRQQGEQMMPGGPDGQGGMQGRGIDPDGDNWTGQNRDGQQMMPGGPDGQGGMQGGMQGRGIDPDGDNWTGQNGGGRDGRGDDGMMQGPDGMMQGPGDWDPNTMLTQEDLQQLLEQFMQQQGGDSPLGGLMGGGHHGFSQGS